MNTLYVINLSKEECDRARDIALSRNKKPSHTDKKFVDKYTGLDIHLWSAIAEVAWAKITGWNVDNETKLGGDGGIDFVNNGKTYQLKVRNIAESEFLPDLLCRLDKAVADRFILADIHEDYLYVVRFVGWCTREELTEEIINIVPYGTRYIRPRHKLRKLPKSIIFAGVPE